MSRIKEIGMIIRKHYSNWQVHVVKEVTSMGYVKNNPIKLGSLSESYPSRKEITEAVEGMGYLVKSINSTTSKLMVDFDDDDVIARIEEALKC